jgi:hypothetical protein
MEFNVIKTVVAIYPGRFQPAGKHHAETFKWLQSKFGAKDTFIATSDNVKLPNSPLNFKEKQAIISKYGFGNNIIQVKNPYKAEEITSKYDPKTTAVVFMVGKKDMQEDPRFVIGKKKDGTDSYFQKYDPDKPMKSYLQHGYLIVAPHKSYDIPGIGEMSGTNIRAALSSPTTAAQYKKNFEGIFGWWDEKLANLMKKKFSNQPLKETIILRSLFKALLMEGGAGGHMAHPFDLDKVKTGNDLVKVFDQTAKFLVKNPAPVKIDGVNASIRLGDIDGKRQFVIDRGSSKELDIKGVTKADLPTRFNIPGHGMIKVGGKVLDIFNTAYPVIKGDLAKLGMIKNPNIMFNIEYVEGKTNVQDYGKNFLAIHNLLEIQQTPGKKSRSTHEIPYSKDVLEDLIKNLQPIAKKYGFEVLSSIPAKIEKTPNFGAALSKSYTVVIDKKNKQTKSLKEWLNDAKNTKGLKLKLKDGKTVDALSKQVFLAVKKGTPLEDLIADPKDQKVAIDSFVIYEATMELGDALLKSMTSPLGPVDQQEGIVVRDPSIDSEPFKITGSFIVRGLETSFTR